MAEAGLAAVECLMRGAAEGPASLGSVEKSEPSPRPMAAPPALAAGDETTLMPALCPPASGVLGADSLFLTCLPFKGVKTSCCVRVPCCCCCCCLLCCICRFSSLCRASRLSEASSSSELDELDSSQNELELGFVPDAPRAACRSASFSDLGVSVPLRL